MWRQSRETHSPEDGERRQLLKVKREVQTETGLKESSDGLWGKKKKKTVVTVSKLYSNMLKEEMYMH